MNRMSPALLKEKHTKNLNLDLKFLLPCFLVAMLLSVL